MTGMKQTLRVSWTENETNECIGIADVTRNFLTNTERQKLNYFGQMMRKRLYGQTLSKGLCPELNGEEEDEELHGLITLLLGFVFLRYFVEQLTAMNGEGASTLGSKMIKDIDKTNVPCWQRSAARTDNRHTLMRSFISNQSLSLPNIK